MTKEILIIQPEYKELTLPRLISNGMVLQRDSPINLWGWANKGEVVTIQFLGNKYQTTTLNTGKWKITIPAQNPGGPYSMDIISDRKKTISDILIGDVWVCSGQSNMGLPMSRTRDLYEEEISLSYNLFIRVFTVPERYDFNIEHEDFSNGKWESANPENVLHFTAIGYFFAASLNEKYHIPIGIIDSSMGGTPIEAWISEKGLQRFPNHIINRNKYKNLNYLNKIISKGEEIETNWHKKILTTDNGLKNSSDLWFSENHNINDWDSFDLPNYWEDTKIGLINGVVWFRKDIFIEENLAYKPAKLHLGRIVDSDTVYINGHLVGTTSYQYPPRKYAIPSNILKPGKNSIVIRVVNSAGKGGFIKDKPYRIIFNNSVLDLTGEWKFKIGAIMDPLPEITAMNTIPTGLYNGMISPIVNYTIKGFNWYQGESNIARAEDYYSLFYGLIRDWRKKWNQGDLPFLYVQLPNYKECEYKLESNNWPLLRDAQLRALDIINAGMVVAIDLGEWNDLHPLNKKDIGQRLSLLAQNMVYGDKNIVSSGPIYKSIIKENNCLVIEFSEIGSGLICLTETINNFLISGTNNIYLKGNAIIKDNKVIVWCDSIEDPISVKYAWADNPEPIGLYNMEGLPASPFKAQIQLG